MRRGDLKSLLPSSIVSSRSPSEVLQELAATSVAGGSGTSSAGDSSGSPAAALSGAIRRRWGRTRPQKGAEVQLEEPWAESRPAFSDRAYLQLSVG